MDKESLPGYQKKSFAMAFGGGEIWFEHLDGIFNRSDLVLQKLQADLPLFCRPSAPSLLAVNLDETDVTDEIISAVAASLLLNTKRFTRVVFVGLSGKNSRKMSKALQARPFALAFYRDFEQAKEWLVSEKPV